MKIPSLAKVERLYDQGTILNFMKFSNGKLAVLNREISILLRALRDQKELSIWPVVIATLKKVRFELVALPVAPVHIITNQLIEQLSSALPICKISFPENLDQLSQIINRLQSFQGQENRFFSWIQAECKEKHGNDTLCILSSRHIKFIENLINSNINLSLRNLKVTSPLSLKNFTFFNRIFLCGSISLFSENQFRNLEYVWRSPRAPEMYFLSYDWIRDDFEPKPAFDIEPNKVAVRIVKQNVAETEMSEEKDFFENDKNRIDIGEIDFSPVELIKPGSSSRTGHYEYICKSRLLALEDGTVIYKEVDSSSRIVELVQAVEIHKIENIKLEPGMPLIVRTEGSGDSVAAVADMLFGEKANKIRRIHEQWKSAFRDKLNSCASVSQVADILTGLGAPTANEINVRNWQRHDTFKPNNEDDFKAIMVFSGLPDIIDECWENAKKIVQMHIKAGREISKLLLSKINDSSMGDLEKYGRIDIEIKGLAGKVSVIRIESIMPDTYDVPSSQLDKAVNIEREL